MTIFKEKVDEEYLTTAEAKAILAEIEADRAADEDRELRYELARAIEHVNRFGHLDAEESRELVEALVELDPIDVSTAVKITDLLPPKTAPSFGRCSPRSATRSTARSSTRSSPSSPSTRDGSDGRRRRGTRLNVAETLGIPWYRYRHSLAGKRGV